MIKENESSTGLGFSMLREDLLNVLSRVVGVAEKRTGFTALSHVRFGFIGNFLVLSATDTEILISEYIELEVAPVSVECFSFTVDVYTLQDIVRKLDSKAILDLHFDHLSMKLSVRSDQCSFVLPCCTGDDFPVIDDSDLVREVAVESALFVKLLESVKFAIAVSSEGRRYNLAGCYLKAYDGNLLAVATDTHRLSYCSCEVPGLLFEFHCIIPRKTVLELAKVVKAGQIKISLPDSNKVNKVAFAFGNTRVVSKVIDAEFPDYDRVVPKNYKFVVTVPRKLLIKAVERVSVIFVDRARSVRLLFNESGSLELLASNTDSSTAKEVIAVSDGKVDFEVGFNHVYLLDMLSSVDGPEVNFHLIDSQSAVMVAEPGAHNRQFCIIMPMSI